MVCALLAHAAALAATLAPAAAQAPREIVAVFPVRVEARVVSARLQPKLLSALEADLVASGRFSIVPRADLQSAIRATKTASFSDCYDEACQIELGKEVAAEKIVQSEVAKLGARCEVTLKLFDLARATASEASTATDECGAEGLRRAVRAAAYRLAGVAPPKRNVSIRFDTVALPTVERPPPSDAQANLQVSLDAVDADALVAYDAAVKTERDPEANTKAKIAAWQKVRRVRAPDLRARAKARLAAWTRYAREEKAAAAARRRFEAKRDRQWKKLSKLLELEVVSETDKQDWAVAFVEAYGGQGQNPYFADPVFNRYVGLAAWAEAASKLGDDLGQRQAALTAFLATYPNCPPAVDAQAVLDRTIAAHVRAVEAPVARFPLPFTYQASGRRYAFSAVTRMGIDLDQCVLTADYDAYHHYGPDARDAPGIPSRPTVVTTGRFSVDLTQVTGWSSSRETWKPLAHGYLLEAAPKAARAVRSRRRATMTAWGERVKSVDARGAALSLIAPDGLTERVAALNALAPLCAGR